MKNLIKKIVKIAENKVEGIIFRAVGKSVEESFFHGIVYGMLGESARLMSKSKMKRVVKNVKLNKLQEAALELIKLQTENDLRKLKENVKYDIVNTLVKVNREKQLISHSKQVVDAVKGGIVEKKSISSIMLDLGNATKKWDLNLGRIVNYVHHQALDSGKAMLYMQQNGQDALVYKDVYQGACKHCQRAYLTAGVGSEPIVFKLSTLIANGTNVGVKAVDYKPVVGNLHVNCRCTLQNVPRDYTPTTHEWNGYDFVRVVKKTKRVRRSKVSVTINGKDYQV